MILKISIILRTICFIAFCFIMLGYTQESHPSQQEDSRLYRTLTDPELKSQVILFLKHVLRQCDENQLMKIVEKHMASSKTNAETYSILLKHKGEAQSYTHFIDQIRALWHQQEVMAEQIKSLNLSGAFRRYVEIGTPGSYVHSMKTLFSVEETFIINSETSLLDYVHGHSWKPWDGFKVYDHFVPLNNYAPISSQAIPEGSIDLVTCFIGLHHIPQEKLIPFITSIYRLLAPGGVFILRDHDAKNEKIVDIIYAAHSLFNIFSANVSLEGEQSEYRHFQPLSHWIEQLTSVGFQVMEPRRLQEGDPTHNTLLYFVTPLKTPEDIEAWSQKIPGFRRDLMGTYLSMPEWHNVMTADEYARFIHHTPFYEFPYLSAVASFWDVFAQSWNQARQEHSFWEVLTHDYTMMNLFVGLFATVEYSLKALISAPIRFFFQGEEARDIQVLLHDPKGIIKTISPDVKVLEVFPGEVVRVQAPRYKEFQRILLSQWLENEGMEVLNIAGHQKIQLTLRHSKDLPKEKLLHPQVKLAYQWDFPTLPEWRFSAVIVDLSALKAYYRFIKPQNIDVFYVHDF